MKIEVRSNGKESQKLSLCLQEALEMIDPALQKVLEQYGFSVSIGGGGDEKPSLHPSQKTAFEVDESDLKAVKLLVTPELVKNLKIDSIPVEFLKSMPPIIRENDKAFLLLVIQYHFLQTIGFFIGTSYAPIEKIMPELYPAKVELNEGSTRNKYYARRAMMIHMPRLTLLKHAYSGVIPTSVEKAYSKFTLLMKAISEGLRT